MQKGEIVCRLFVPAHQDTSKAIHPRMCALDNPAPSLLARLVVARLGFLATRPNMGGEPTFLADIAAFLIVVPLVQAPPLRRLRRWGWTFDHEAIERGAHPLHVMPVGTIHRQPQGHTGALGQQATLHPAFGTIGRSWPGVFPPRAEPGSSRRPGFARSSQDPAVRQPGPLPCARISRRRPRRPLLESGRGRWSWHTTRSDGGLPIGSPCGARKTWRRHRGDPAHAAGRHQSGGYAPGWGAVVRERPTAHQKRGIQ
jgi:hypothetical protein